MIIKRVTSFPREAEIAPWAADEIIGREDLADAALRSSEAAWIVSVGTEPVFLVGIWKMSLLGSGTRLWFVPFRAINRHLRKVVALVKRALPRLSRACRGLSILVHEDEPRNIRFARFFGFVKGMDKVGKYHWYYLR